MTSIHAALRGIHDPEEAARIRESLNAQAEAQQAADARAEFQETHRQHVEAERERSAEKRAAHAAEHARHVEEERTRLAEKRRIRREQEAAYRELGDARRDDTAAAAQQYRQRSRTRGERGKRR